MRIWCNMSFPPPAARLLEQGLAGHELLPASNLTNSNLVDAAADPLLHQADVAFGQPAAEAVISSPSLRWVHLTSAGYERYDTPDFLAELKGRGVAMTTSSAVYDEPCAQHALAMMLGLSRMLPRASESQQRDHGWPAAEVRSRSQLLLGQCVLLLGFGAIAQRLVELLAPFRMRLLAIRRTVSGSEPIPAYPQSEIDRLLPLADHVVNILPGGEATRNFLDARRIARMKPTANFYNIGRGSTVDQDALMAALRERRLAGAYLDVMTPEPLPPEHPLWSTPNCHITPHSAGGHAGEFERLVRHFVNNLELFTSGRGMRNRIV
jgi:phosphoglycerate dehydrogenase-like enzyme